MDTLKINKDTQILPDEIRWEFSRSSGPGGQHVNKVSSKVTLVFDLNTTDSLTENQKSRLKCELKRFIDKNGFMRVNVEEERSQHKNRKIAVTRFIELLSEALKPCKQRKQTAVPKRSDEKRLTQKRKKARLKEQRQPPDVNE
jgi:ribosome-associated protein